MCRVTGAETGATGVKSRGHRGENHTGAAEMPGFFTEKPGYRGEKAGFGAVYRGKKAPKAGFPLAVRADFAGIWGGA